MEPGMTEATSPAEGRLVLVRHGESQFNLANRFTGWTDVPLTDRGRREATEAGAALRDMAFDRAFCSGLIRSIESAHLLLAAAEQPDVPLVQAVELNERRYGDLEGLGKDEAIARFGEAQVHLWRRSYLAAPPGGESLADATARILPFVRARILPPAGTGNVLVLAHGNTLRAIVRELRRLTDEELMRFDIPTGTILIFRIAAGAAPELVSERVPQDPDPRGSLL